MTEANPGDQDRDDLSLSADPTDPGSIEMITAALRTDTAEIDTLARVLTATLGDSLPPGMVEIERSRSLSDRLSGRDGTPTSITVTTPDVQLRLAPARGRGGPVKAERQKIVRGVVISRSEIDLDEWIRTLAGLLGDLAARNAAARASLAKLLGQS